MQTALDMVKNIHHHELKEVARIQEVLLNAFNNHGCKMVETPIFEDYDTYAQELPHLRKQFVKTIDADGSVLVLRPDVTMPLVKSIAQEYEDSQSYLKFAYITPVFLDYQGRHRGGREFLQGGVEILGSTEPDSDSEIISMAMDILFNLGVTDIQVDIGTVAFSDAFFSELTLEKNQIEKIKTAIEMRNLDELEQLGKEYNLEAKDREFILALPKLFGPYEKAIVTAKSLCRNRYMVQALERLEEVVKQLKWIYPDKEFSLDFAFSNRLNYYTDIVFKIYAPNSPYALVDGGRYDLMSQKFGVNRPACGFGININLLYEYLAENQLAGKEEPVFDLLLRYTSITEDLFTLLAELRKLNMKVVAYPVYSKIDRSDFKLIGSYENGQFVVDNIGRNKDEFISFCKDTFIKI